MFRRGDFRRRELRRKVNEILQISKMSEAYNPALTPINQNNTTFYNQSPLTPVNQTAMTLVHQSTVTPLYQTAIMPCADSASAAPVCQIQQTGYQPQYSASHVARNDYPQYSEHHVTTATDEKYYPESQFWTSTPKHYNYSQTSYS